MPVSSASAVADLPDNDLVERARAREPAAFEALIQRCLQGSGGRVPRETTAS